MLPQQKLSKNIKVIAFDLGGVVFENDPELKAYHLLSAKFGIKKELIASLLNQNNEIFHQGRISENEYWIPLTSQYNIPPLLCKKYYRQSVSLIPEVFQYLKMVYQRYDCYTLNNEPKEWMNYRINKFKLNKYFKGFVTSSRFGVTKPNPQLYKIFLNIVKARPNQILFIDNARENLKPARDLGFETFLYKKE